MPIPLLREVGLLPEENIRWIGIILRRNLNPFPRQHHFFYLYPDLKLFPSFIASAAATATSLFLVIVEPVIHS
jgi:hypothetical protein